MEKQPRIPVRYQSFFYLVASSFSGCLSHMHVPSRCSLTSIHVPGNRMEAVKIEKERKEKKGTIWNFQVLTYISLIPHYIPLARTWLYSHSYLQRRPWNILTCPSKN